jgi:two-component system, LuxR family, sensor kinase FixL
VQTEQVVFNLVRNAVEATAGSTPCVLTVASELTPEGLIQISIADNGPGLPSTVRAKLFEPFITTKSSGLGVGLSICRVIIEAHGGRLWAEDNPGGGTIFRFTLPQEPADITDEEKQPQA